MHPTGAWCFEEFENISKLITENLDTKTRNNLEQELKNVFETSAGMADRFAILNDESITETLNASRKGIRANKNRLNMIIPTANEFKSAVLEVTKESTNKNIKLSNVDINCFVIE